MAAGPRVLFLHGLETDPRKQKGSEDGSLTKAFGAAVHGPDFELGTADLSRANSVARNFLRLPAVHLAALLSATSAVAGGVRRLPLRLAVIGAGAPWCGIAANYEHLKGEAIELSLERCVLQARKSMDMYKPDVLSGMSWGGAVASLLVQRGHWTGPVVLLAPAGQQLATYLSEGSKSRAEVRLAFCAVRAPPGVRMP